MIMGLGGHLLAFPFSRLLRKLSTSFPPTRLFDNIPLTLFWPCKHAILPLVYFPFLFFSHHLLLQSKPFYNCNGLVATRYGVSCSFVCLVADTTDAPHLMCTSLLRTGEGEVQSCK
ncbi:hypothetical protein EJ05DRAFT_224047 [Pseudovirgaria hyperparasitica]|uniref:Uncharacterized protein n=1 Tax=Pseudovirgaria hyperparasitica TaxID=470096 RepID=A0A6A6VTM4_9PEZI|nr:uncharacterized protein EJ05DRAFT_224047 [Pseudovirgaria hyperparasitica]KAF2753239.1 hypothetical protein EJ05DRAFT_224047 [Pseudovirgaria hyperparasitica]